MRPVIEVMLVILLAVSLGFVLNRSAIQLGQEQQAMEAKIDQLVQSDPVTLTDFVSALGEPASLGTVTCGGAKCLSATWDLSLSTQVCWKRLSVVLDESQMKVFLAETHDIVLAGQTANGPRCVQVTQ